LLSVTTAWNHFGSSNSDSLPLPPEPLRRNRSIAFQDPRFQDLEGRLFARLEGRADPAGLAEPVPRGLGKRKVERFLRRVGQLDGSPIGPPAIGSIPRKTKTFPPTFATRSPQGKSSTAPGRLIANSRSRRERGRKSLPLEAPLADRGAVFRPRAAFRSAEGEADFFRGIELSSVEYRRAAAASGEGMTRNFFFFCRL